MIKYLSIALLFSILLASFFFYRAEAYQEKYNAEKAEKDALIARLEKEAENSKKLSKTRIEANKNEKASYRSWADTAVDADFKLYMSNNL